MDSRLRWQFSWLVRRSTTVNSTQLEWKNSICQRVEWATSSCALCCVDESWGELSTCLRARLHPGVLLSDVNTKSRRRQRDDGDMQMMSEISTAAARAISHNFSNKIELDQRDIEKVGNGDKRESAFLVFFVQLLLNAHTKCHKKGAHLQQQRAHSAAISLKMSYVK